MANGGGLQFWFEFASTYSYLAAMRIEAAAEKNSVQLEWKPFLLGPLFASFGWSDSPFNVYPVKGAYMWRDMERLCEEADLPWVRPTVFPRNGLMAARVACVGAREGWAGPFVRAVFNANFARDEDIASWPVLDAILTELGHDASAVRQQALSATTKETLRAQTEQAVTLGIFGAPTFVVSEELFWGNDRLDQALRWANPKSSI